MSRRRQPPDHVKKKAASWLWQEEGITLIMAWRRQPPDHGKEKASSLIMARRRQSPKHGKKKASSRLWQWEGILQIMETRRQSPKHGKKKASFWLWQEEASSRLLQEEASSRLAQEEASSRLWQEEGIALIMAEGEASFLSSLNGVADTPTRARQEERGRGRWRRAPGTGILHLVEQRLKQANLYIKRGLLGKIHKVIRNVLNANSSLPIKSQNKTWTIYCTVY
jgi:hypothetical protein